MNQALNSQQEGSGNFNGLGMDGGRGLGVVILSEADRL